MLYIFTVSKTWSENTIKNLKNSGLVKKADNILDYGCGLGIWDNEVQNNEFYNKLYLYDMNPEIREHCKKNYPNYIVVNDMNSELDVNLIFFNGVVQYIGFNNLKKLFGQFATMLKKDEVVIITDFPRYPRVLECILTFFHDFNLFKIQVKQFLNSEYRKIDFYRHSIEDLETIVKNNFKITKIKNVSPNKNRDTLMFKKLNK
mgnify:FL=1